MPAHLPRRVLALAFFLSLGAGVRADDVPATCRYANIATLPVRYLSESFHPAVEGVINGAPARMLLDTGANSTYLTRKATDRFGLPLRMTGTYTAGVGGASRMYSTEVQDLGLGPARSGKARLMVIGDMGGRPQYDAIVGADFLLQADMEIALAAKELRFFRARDCADRALAYWSPDAIELPFDGSFGNSRNPVFSIEVNGKKMSAAIDSGASHSVVFLRAARKAGIDTDAPGALKGQDAVGVGAERVKRWNARFDSITIGSETIRNAQIDILDNPSSGRVPADVLLGADFLRAHRVLFAMSQRRIYLSYVGGEVFTSAFKGIEPWLQQEADAGNPDAEFALHWKYVSGNGVAADLAAASNWLRKAAEHGHPTANYLVGRMSLKAGRYAEAARQLAISVDQKPDERRAALHLYLARLLAGDPATAARELELRFAADQGRWPAPIADFYLGRIGADALLAQAARQSGQSAPPACEAAFFQAALYLAQGDKSKSEAARTAQPAGCNPRANY